MIRSFKNSGTEDIFNGKNTKAARKICPRQLWKIAARKLEQLDSVVALEELRIPTGNHLETLSGDRVGNTASESMKDFGYASDGRIPDLMKLNLLTITEFENDIWFAYRRIA